MSRPILRIVRSATAAAIFLAASLTTQSAYAGAVEPASPQPKASQLKPGLAVFYSFNFVRAIKWNQMDALLHEEQ